MDKRKKTWIESLWVLFPKKNSIFVKKNKFFYMGALSVCKQKLLNTRKNGFHDKKIRFWKFHYFQKAFHTAFLRQRWFILNIFYNRRNLNNEYCDFHTTQFLSIFFIWIWTSNAANSNSSLNLFLSGTLRIPPRIELSYIIWR